jgi:ubiquitin-conjugating enzyme E2 Q
MPRKAFIADLHSAVGGISIAGISNVQPGGDDGEFTFECIADGDTLQISALIPGMFPHPHPL